MTARLIITGLNGQVSPTAFQDMGRGLAFQINKGGPKSQPQTPRSLTFKGGRVSPPEPAADLAEVLS